MSDIPELSVIIPTLDEADWVGPCLQSVAASLDRAEISGEMLVVDGGSRDGTRDRARRAGADRVVSLDSPGRATQLNEGAARARGAGFVFLHADSLVGPEWASTIREALDDDRVGGWFPVDIVAETDALVTSNLLGLVAGGINVRTRCFCTATGDQSLFVDRDVFDTVGGIPEQPILEGNAFARALREHGSVAIGDRPIRISGRRWEEHGLIRTMLLMYAVRAGARVGVGHARLARFWRRWAGLDESDEPIRNG